MINHLFVGLWRSLSYWIIEVYGWRLLSGDGSMALLQILHFSNKCSLVPFLSHQTTIHPQQRRQKPQLQARISQKRPKHTKYIVTFTAITSPGPAPLLPSSTFTIAQPSLTLNFHPLSVGKYRLRYDLYRNPPLYFLYFTLFFCCWFLDNLVK